MQPGIFQKISDAFKGHFISHGSKVLDTVESVTTHTNNRVGEYVSPLRQSILKRFPVLFGLLVTMGVVATFLGIEQLLLQSNILENSPELILILGLSILAFTGKLYKKLE